MSRSFDISCLGAIALAVFALGCGSEVPQRFDVLTDAGSDQRQNDTRMDLEDTVSDVPLDPDAPVGLKNGVQAGMDGDGVPHLFAQTDEDLLFAQGYHMAKERLFSIDSFRRRASGRLSEWWGESALAGDKMMRTLGFARIGLRNLQYLKETSPRDYRLLRSYIAGVNRRVKEVRAGTVPLPESYGPEGVNELPELFMDQDVTTMGALLVFGFGAQIEFEILASAVLALMDDGDLLPAYEPGMPTFIMESGIESGENALATHEAAQGAGESTERRFAAGASAMRGAFLRPRQPLSAKEWAEVAELFQGAARWRAAIAPASGSNNWVVSGKHTENGSPLLASDPHVGYSTPNDLYLMHLNSSHAKGSLDVVGWAFPGIPGIQMGHNRHVAWAPTVNFADVADAWMVEVKDGQALVGGKSVALESRTEEIRVKDAAGQLQVVQHTVDVVPGYGVLLPAEVLPVPTFLLGKGSVMINWVGFDTPDSLTLYNDFDRAGNLDEFDQAVLGQRLGIMNWIFASAEGWRYRAYGKIPDRGPASGRPVAWLVMDGSDASTLWTGKWLEESQTPRVADDRAYLARANNDPWGHCSDGNPGNDEFYYGAYYLPGFRAHSIEAGLDQRISQGKVTVAQMQSLQMDAHSTLADVFIPFLEEALAALPTAPELASWKENAEVKALAQRLLDWDRSATRFGQEGAIFRIWYAHVARETLGDEMKIAFDGMEGAQAIILARFVANTLRQQIPELMDRTRNELMMAALEKTVAAMEERGKETYVFADLARAVFYPPTQEPAVAVPKEGDDSSVNVTQCSMWTDGVLNKTCDSAVGSVFRAVYEFQADGSPLAHFNMPEGNASSTKEWVEGTYRVLQFPRLPTEIPYSEMWSLNPDE